MNDPIKKARQARRFPTNTCPASRHLQMIGEALYRGKPYPMLTEEPEHCGGSMLETVTALYETRTERDKLRAAVEALAAIVQRDRVALYQAHGMSSGIAADAEGREALAEYDAALALADAAMNKGSTA